MPSSYSSPFAPLPGSGAPPRGLFVDRWGTLLVRPKQGFCTRFDRVEFIPGALDALFHAGQAGWRLYLLGNEDAVAFGKLSEPKWKALEDELIEHMNANGVPVTRSYACIDHPLGVEDRQADSVYLLPNTGALYHAMQVDGIDLRESWVIGDSTLELVAGWRAGCHLAGVRTGEALQDGQLEVEPEIMGASIAEAVAEISAGAGIPRW